MRIYGKTSLCYSLFQNMLVRLLLSLSSRLQRRRRLVRRYKDIMNPLFCFYIGHCDQRIFVSKHATYFEKIFQGHIQTWTAGLGGGRGLGLHRTQRPMPLVFKSIDSPPIPSETFHGCPLPYLLGIRGLFCDEAGLIKKVRSKYLSRLCSLSSLKTPIH